MTIMRASLPEEFFDVTSKDLLKQPEPQYVHANLCKMAMAANLDAPSFLGVSADRQVGEHGADYSDIMFDRLVTTDPIMTEAIHVVAELGKTPGQTIRMNRPKFTDTTYTEAARTIASGAQISTVPVDLQSEQVAITIKRFGGPYDQTNTRVAPYAVDRLDAKMSVHSLAKLVGKHLKRDFDKFLDKELISLVDLAASVIYPSNFASDNSIVSAGTAPLDFNTIARAEAALDNLNIPVFANGRRIALFDATQLQQLKDDAQFARYAEFHPPANPILAQAYYKTIGGLDVYKSTSLTQAVNGSSVSVHYGQVFGPGMLGVGFGEAPRTAFSNNDNYGEQALVVWLLYAGFVNLDTRFACSVRTG